MIKTARLIELIAETENTREIEVSDASGKIFLSAGNCNIALTADNAVLGANVIGYWQPIDTKEPVRITIDGLCKDPGPEDSISIRRGEISLPIGKTPAKARRKQGDSKRSGKKEGGAKKQGGTSGMVETAMNRYNSYI